MTRLHVFATESPAFGQGLHFVELLVGECDQGRRVVNRRAGVQRLECGRLGDQRFPHAGRGTDQHPFARLEPRKQCLLLHRVRRKGQLVEILERQLVAIDDSGRAGIGRHAVG